MNRTFSILYLGLSLPYFCGTRLKIGRGYMQEQVRCAEHTRSKEFILNKTITANLVRKDAKSEMPHRAYTLYPYRRFPLVQYPCTVARACPGQSHHTELGPSPCLAKVYTVYTLLDLHTY